MKKRLLLWTILVVALTCVLAISVSAAGATSNEYGEVTTIEGVTEPSVIDATSRVVLKASDGTFYTFPSYYILTDRSEFTWKINSEVNTILGISETNALNMKNYVVRMEIPEGIVTINKENKGGAYAFEKSTSIIEFTWPSTLNYIGHYSFGQCPNLANIVNIDKYFKNVLFLGNHAFYQNKWGEGMVLEIPSTITTLPERCFQYTKISKAIIPSSVTALKSHVFASCSNLTEIEFAEDCRLTEIGNYCFEYTPLTSFDFTQFSSSLSTLGEGVFNQCKSLTTVTGYGLLSNEGITAVGNIMFAQCPLTNIEFPPNITSIGKQAFYLHKSNQSELRIPNGVTTIGQHAFARSSGNKGGADGLKIYLPASLETLGGTYIFEYWYYEEMYIPAGVSIPEGFVNGTLQSGAVYYYTGDIDTLTINSTNNTALLNAEWISVKDFTGASSEKNYIVYNYNFCDAFYNGAHNTEGVAGENQFKGDAYVTDYICISDCSRNCGMQAEEKLCGPLFTNKGYSKVEDGSMFTYGVVINEDNIATYVAITKEAFNYGVIIGATELDENGAVVDKDAIIDNTGKSLIDNSIVVDFAKVELENFTIYNVKMQGIETEAQQKLPIYCCAYIIDGSAVYYMGDSVSDKPTTISSSAIEVIEKTTTTPATGEEENA